MNFIISTTQNIQNRKARMLSVKQTHTFPVVPITHMHTHTNMSARKHIHAHKITTFVVMF